MKVKHQGINYLFNFIAVITGVYLTFYMNEQAQPKQEQKEIRLLMESIVSELESNKEIYTDYQIPVNERQTEDIETLLPLLSAGLTDSIAELLAAVLQVENYAPSSSTYSRIKSAGKLGLIENLELRTALSRCFEVFVAESEAKGTFQAEYFTGQLLTWMTDSVDLLTMEIKAESEPMVLTNKLIIYQSLIDQKTESYRMIVEESEALKAQIETVFQEK